MTRRNSSLERARRTIAVVVALVLVFGWIAWQSPIRLGPTVAAQDATTAEITGDEHAGGGGGKNIVQVKNQKDGRLRIRGNVQLNHIPGPNVAPVNFAFAEASCTDCQTIAVALQIDLISTHATQVTPQNAAVAVNYQCTRCITAAVALQYVYSVDDPTQTPNEVKMLIHSMDSELRAVSTDKDASVADALTRIDQVIGEFTDLAKSLDDKRDEATEATSPQATPADFASPVATPTGLTPVSTAAGSSTTAPNATATSVAPTSTAATTPAATESEPTVAASEPTDTPIATATPATPTG